MSIVIEMTIAIPSGINAESTVELISQIFPYKCKPGYYRFIYEPHIRRVSIYLAHQIIVPEQQDWIKDNPLIRSWTWRKEEFEKEQFDLPTSMVIHNLLNMNVNKRHDSDGLCSYLLASNYCAPIPEETNLVFDYSDHFGRYGINTLSRTNSGRLENMELTDEELDAICSVWFKKMVEREENNIKREGYNGPKKKEDENDDFLSW